MTTILDNQRTDLHLCEECAKTRGELEFSSEAQVSLGEMLAALLHHQGVLKQATSEEEAHSRCAVCGLSYERFTTQGKLGCSQCFQQFDRQLRNVLRHVHGSTRHTGRAPKRAQSAVRLHKQLEQLRYDLSQSVEAEKFEQAAEIRDRIKWLEEQIRAVETASKQALGLQQGQAVKGEGTDDHRP